MADPRTPQAGMGAAFARGGARPIAPASARTQAAQARARRAAQTNPQGTARSQMSQILGWIRQNPGQAALMLAESVGMDPRPPWMREKKDPKELGKEAGLLAAGAVPIVGPLGRVGSKVAGVAKKADDAAEVASRAAGAARPRPLSNARSGGKGSGQKPGGSNRLTPREAETKRAGRRQGRTAEGARAVEAQEAAAAGRTSINTGRRSPVAPRPAGNRLPKTAEETGLMNRISAKRSEALKTGKKGKTGGRTKAEQKRVVEDVKETMRGQLARRDRGAAPGEDVPDLQGNLPAGSGMPAQVPTSRTPRTPRPASGGTSSTRKPGSAVVSTGRGSTTREATGRRPKRPSSEVARRPGNQVVQGRVVRERREPIDMTNARPIRRPIGEIGSGRGAGASAGRGGPRAAIGSGRTAAAPAGKGKSSKGKKALIGVGALAGAGLLAKQFDSDKSPTAATASDSTSKPTPKPRPASTLRDKYGRQISREEFNRREAYRKSLEGMSDAEKRKARKAEMKRREQYRETEGTAKFGKRANLITRNRDIREGVSSRKVNKEMKAAAGRSGSRQAAMAARQPYLRKKK